MDSYEMSNVMNCCDTVLLFQRDALKEGVTGLSILKCRYSNAYVQKAVPMMLLPANAKVYEVDTTAVE